MEGKISTIDSLSTICDSAPSSGIHPGINQRSRAMPIVNREDIPEGTSLKELVLVRGKSLVTRLKKAGIGNVLGIRYFISEQDIRMICGCTLPQCDVYVVAPMSRRGLEFATLALTSIGQRLAIRFVPLPKRLLSWKLPIPRDLPARNDEPYVKDAIGRLYE